MRKRNIKRGTQDTLKNGRQQTFVRDMKEGDFNDIHESAKIRTGMGTLNTPQVAIAIFKIDLFAPPCIVFKSYSEGRVQKKR